MGQFETAPASLGEMLGISQSNPDDMVGGWLHPFEDNLLDIKEQIVEEFLPWTYPGPADAWTEDAHLDLCRQLAGGN